MNQKLSAFLVISLFLLSSCSVVPISSAKFTASFDSTSVEVTEPVETISLNIQDTIETKYADYDEPLSLRIIIESDETGKTVDQSYSYELNRRGNVDLRQTIVLNEFDGSDFPDEQQTDLGVKFKLDHQSMEEQVRTSTVTINRQIDRTFCRTILESDNSKSSGTYMIQPDGYTSSFEVYCDMDTRGGGWTAVWSNTGGPLQESDTSNSELWSNANSVVATPYSESGELDAERNIEAWNHATGENGGEWLKTIRDYDSDGNLVDTIEINTDGYSLGTPSDVVLRLDQSVSFNDFVGEHTTVCHQLPGSVELIRYQDGSKANHGSTNYVGSVGGVEDNNLGFANIDSNNCGQSSDNVMDSWIAKHVISYTHTSSGKNAVRCQFECWNSEDRVKETVWYYRSGEPVFD